MRTDGPVVEGQYTDVTWHQFEANSGMVRGARVAGVLTWPIIVPLAVVARMSDFAFGTIAQLLAIVPYVFGIIARYEFYRWTLKACGENVHIGFGTALVTRDVSIGRHVVIGNFNTIHYCDIGSYVMTADGCRFYSGTQYHNMEKTDRPMALQGGKVTRVVLGDDVWVGANAVVLASVGEGGVVGAGAVVTRPVVPFSIVTGNPATEIRRRTSS